ncbi:IclR family transcriptional regulator [Tissierella praeacuta]|uniref:IclR family transcriptional regulator n=1 Tax=Tissierella praeacuta TaxID=43131 RepID=UPI00351500CA
MNNEADEKQKKIIKSVIKTFDVIEHIALSDRELGVTEISEALNYGVSATYHLLNTLKECNIVEQNETTKKFKLSLKLWQIGMLAYGQNNISLLLKPYLRKLKELTGETSNLTILDNNQIVYIAQEESSRLLKMFTKIGASAPLHCTGSGKILLTYQPKAKQEHILNSIELTKYTNKTITDKDKLMEEMDIIKKQGYGLDDEERELGVSCIGAPIFGINNEIIACISISGPKSRFTKENKDKWINIILQISKEATDYIRNLN